MQRVTRIHVEGEFAGSPRGNAMASYVRDRPDQPIGVWRLPGGGETPLPEGGLRFSGVDLVSALGQARTWVKAVVGRASYVYWRTSGQVIAQYYHDPWDGAVSGAFYSDGELFAVQHAPGFDDCFEVLEQHKPFGLLGAVFVRWYIAQEVDVTEPLVPQLRGRLVEARSKLSTLLRWEDKGVIASTDPRLLLGLSQVFGASAALAFLQEAYPLELDVQLVEGVGYPLGLALEVLPDYYGGLLRRKDHQEDVKLLERLCVRPFQPAC